MIRGNLFRVSREEMINRLSSAAMNKHFVTIEAEKSDGSYRKLNGQIENVGDELITIKDFLSDGSNNGYRRVSLNRLIKVSIDKNIFVPNYFEA